MANIQASGHCPIRIAIIGGGIGGLATLLGILHHTERTQVIPHLYEAASQFSEIGAGVGFGPNAVRAMEVVDPALHKGYLSIAARAPVVLRDGQEMVAWHYFVMGMDGRGGVGVNDLEGLEEIPGATPYNHNKTHNVHRASFLEEMLKLLRSKGEGEYVTFRKRLQNIAESERGLKLSFSDGSIEEVDAVIGADGVKSRVRPIVLGNDYEPRFTGKYTYRGLVPIQKVEDCIGHWAHENIILTGYGGHIVGFPIDQGKTFNIVAFNTPKTEGRTWEQGDEWVVKSSPQAVLGDFEGWDSRVCRMLSMMEQPDKWGLFDVPPLPSYVGFAGKVVLLGDCAHASTPHQGAGAGMAIEDAAVISTLLGAFSRRGQGSIGEVFSTFDKLRRERTQKLAATSREAGLLYDFELEGIKDDVDRIRDFMSQRMQWIWEYDAGRAAGAGLGSAEHSS